MAPDKFTQRQLNWYELPPYKFDPEAPVDALCLEQAYRFVETCLNSTIAQCANQYDVPLDTLEALVCDRFIFRRAGTPPCPIEWFVEEANDREVEPLVLPNSPDFPQRVGEADDNADISLTLNRSVGSEIA